MPLPLLSLLVWLPIAGGSVVLLLGDRGSRRPLDGAVASLATFVARLPL